MDAKLISSYRYLSEVTSPYDRVTSERLACLADGWEKRLQAAARRPSGVLVAFYTCLESACGAGDLGRASEISKLLAEASEALEAAQNLARSTMPCERYAAILDSALSHGGLWKPFDDAATVTLPSEEGRAKSLEALEVALTQIQTLVPSYYEELCRCVTNIFIIRTDCMNAGSSFLTYGVIFLRELQKGQDWTAYFEHLIHEAAHHALFAIMASHRLFLETQPDGRYASPFRSEPRPLDAIYHAAFVLSRLCDALEIAKLGAVIRTYARTARYNYENPKPIPAQFYDAYDVLVEHAHLTKEGREVLESARAVVDRYL